MAPPPIISSCDSMRLVERSANLKVSVPGFSNQLPLPQGGVRTGDMPDTGFRILG